jgi:hypothetical protein
MVSSLLSGIPLKGRRDPRQEFPIPGGKSPKLLTVDMQGLVAHTAQAATTRVAFLKKRVRRRWIPV